MSKFLIGLLFVFGLTLFSCDSSSIPKIELKDIPDFENLPGQTNKTIILVNPDNNKKIEIGGILGGELLDITKDDERRLIFYVPLNAVAVYETTMYGSDISSIIYLTNNENSTEVFHGDYGNVADEIDISYESIYVFTQNTEGAVESEIDEKLFTREEFKAFVDTHNAFEIFEILGEPMADNWNYGNWYYNDLVYDKYKGKDKLEDVEIQFREVVQRETFPDFFEKSNLSRHHATKVKYGDFNKNLRMTSMCKCKIGK
jgi:hypothetical protein